MHTEAISPRLAVASEDTRSTALWWLLAAAGLLILVGGAAHPQSDKALDYDHYVSEILHHGAWPFTHTLQLLGLALTAVAVFRIRATEGRAWSVTVRAWSLALGCAAVLGVVEMVPHLLAYLQVADFDRTGSATLLTVHTAIQFVSAPVLGASFAGLAIVTSKHREFGNGRWLAVVAVLGGAISGAVGVLMPLAKDPSLAPMFAGAVGYAIWLVVGSARRALATRQATT